MTGLLVELRRGPGPWLCPVLLAAGIWYVLATVDTFTVWADSTQAVANAPFLLAPILAGAAAWAGSRGPRRAVWHRDMLAARGPAAGPSVEMVALMLWAFASYVVLAAAVLIVTALQADWGGPSLWWLAGTASGLVVCVPIGWVVGRLAPLRFTPPIVAVAVFVSAGWVDGLIGGSDWWGRFLPVGLFWRWVPFTEVREFPFLIEIVFNVSVVVVVLAGLGALWRDRRWRVLSPGMAAVVVVGLSVVVMAVDGGQFDRRPAEQSWYCEGEQPELCVHPAYSAFASDLQARAELVADQLDGTPFAFSRAEQLQEHVPTPGAVWFGVYYPLSSYVDVAAHDMASAALGHDRCFVAGATPNMEEPDPESVMLLFLLVEWIATSGGEVGDIQVWPEEPYEWFASQSAVTMRAWINTHADQIRTCSLTSDDLR